MTSNFLYVGTDGAELSQLRESLSSHTDASLDVIPTRDEVLNFLSSSDYDCGLVFVQGDLVAANFIDSLRQSERCLPVIVLMAKEDLVWAEKVLSLGAVDCLSIKDLEQGQLSRCIRYALAQRQLWLAIRSRDESCQRLTSIIESSEDAVFSETAGVIVTWNQGAEELFGYSAAEVIGQTFELFTPPEQIAERLALLERVRQGERIAEHETLRRRKDGTLVEISLSIAPLFNADNHVNGAACTARDNTRQKRDQEALRQSEKLYHALASNFPNGSVYMLDLDSRFVLAEGRGLATVGLSREKVLGRTVFEVFGDGDLGHSVYDAYRQALDGIESIMETEIRERIRLLRIIPVRDEQGRVISVLAMTQDITEQKQNQAALERSEKLYATLARNFPNGSVLLLDRDLRFVLAEGRGLVQLGLDREQMIGKSLHEIFGHLSGAEKLESLYEQALQGQEINAEVIIDGMHRWVHVLPIRENGEISGVMGMSQDITGLKQTEKALRESEEMNQAILDSMLANIVVLDGQGIITAVNEPWCQFARENSFSDPSSSNYGIGTNYLDACYKSIGDSSQQFTEATDGIREVLEGKKTSFSLEYPCHSPQQKLWFQMTVTPLSTEREGVVVAHIPITERKQAEEELRRNQEQLTLAQGIAHLGHMQYDAKLGKSFWSDEVYRIYGLQPQSIEGNYQQFLNFVHPEDRWMLSPETQDFYATNGTIQHEFRIVRPNGEIRWVNGQAQGYHDKEGNLTSFIGTVFDITDLKQTQDERDRFFELSLDIMMVSDLQGVIRRVNPAWTRILGHSSEEISGRKFIEFVHPDDIEATLGEARNIYEGENVYGFENRYRCHDGSYKLLEWNSIFHSDTGLIYSVSTDVTERRDAEETMRANEERLRFVTDNARVGLVMLDDERRYTFANATYAEILGLPSSDIVGLRVADVLAPIYEEQICPQLDRAFDGERVIYELRLPSLEGDRSFMVKYEPTKVDGLVSHVVVVITDITERKQAEESVRESESRVAGIVNAAMDAIITIDETQRIILFNPAAEQMFGYDSSVVLGQTIEFLMPERFRAAHGDHIRLFGQRGITSRKMGALGALSGLRADGEEFPIEASISQIEIAGQTLFTVILRDITERKLAEAALQRAHDDLEKRVEERTNEIQKVNESLRVEAIERKMALDALRESAKAVREAQQMLQLVINHIPQAIFWKDQNSKYLGCNYRLALDAGYSSPEELNGKSDWEMPWAEYADDYRTDDRQVMEMDTPKLNIEEELVRADGSPAWLRTNKIPLHDNEDKVVGVLCSYEDITEQKLAEAAIHTARREADAANMAKSEFLSRMSHELRTPMNSILGFAQIIEMSSTDAKQLQRVKHIMKAGRHLLQLINEVLDVARVESGQLSLSPEPVPVGNIIQMTADLVRPLCQQNSLSIELDLDSCGDFYVQADQQRLSQVLLNLFANAAKYNRDNGEIRAQCEVRGDDKLRINILDTGYGIDSEHLSKLFQPFERLGREGGPIEGTGLGLALSQRIMEAMGGTIGVESTVGEGSTFWIELPLVEGPMSRVSTTLTPAPRITGPTNSHTVLYIEDNVANFQVLEHLLESEPNINLISAMQGQIGIELARQHLPSLILLDLHLPDIAGDEVLRRLLAEPALREIPVFMLSADATPAQIARLIAAGAREYLTKPLDLQYFLSVVHKYLSATS